MGVKQQWDAENAASKAARKAAIETERRAACYPALLAALELALVWYDDPRHQDVIQPRWVGDAREALKQAQS